MLMRCRAGRMIGAPLMLAVQLGECDHRAGEGQRADGDAERQFDQALRLDVARSCRCRRRPAHRTRRPPPAPRPCRPASGTPRPAAASRSSAPGARSPRQCRRRSPTPRITSTQAMPSAGGCAASVVATAIAMPIMPKRLPCAARRRARQPAQRQDEQDAGDEIGDCGEIGVHLRPPSFVTARCIALTTSRVLSSLGRPHLLSSCTSPACAG